MKCRSKYLYVDIVKLTFRDPFQGQIVQIRQTQLNWRKIYSTHNSEPSLILTFLHMKYLIQ